ncbi:MAG: hypothetical protein QXI97_02430 [Nitrososphaerota archaeon]
MFVGIVVIDAGLQLFNTVLSHDYIRLERVESAGGGAVLSPVHRWGAVTA